MKESRYGMGERGDLMKAIVQERLGPPYSLPACRS
jgi:hypothetical protein